MAAIRTDKHDSGLAGVQDGSDRADLARSLKRRWKTWEQKTSVRGGKGDPAGKLARAEN